MIMQKNAEATKNAQKKSMNEVINGLEYMGCIYGESELTSGFTQVCRVYRQKSGSPLCVVTYHSVVGNGAVTTEIFHSPVRVVRGEKRVAAYLDHFSDLCSLKGVFSGVRFAARDI